MDSAKHYIYLCSIHNHQSHQQTFLLNTIECVKSILKTYIYHILIFMLVSLYICTTNYFMMSQLRVLNVYSI